MLKYLLPVLLAVSIVNGRERVRRVSEADLIANWQKTAEEAVEKKDWLKALQNYDAIRSRYKESNKEKYDVLGSHMNKIFWYCLMYYCRGEKKDYKEAKWYIDQRVSRNLKDEQARTFQGWLNSQNNEGKIQEFLDKKYWMVIKECLVAKKNGEGFCEAQWWLKKRLEIVPDDEKARMYLKTLKANQKAQEDESRTDSLRETGEELPTGGIQRVHGDDAEGSHQGRRP